MPVTNNRVRPIITRIALLSIGLASMATYGQGAHVHGTATLSIAALDSTVLVEFESPAANLVGFENKAETKEQRQQVLNTGELLIAGQNLFSFNGASCQLTETENNLIDVLFEEHHVDNHNGDNDKHIKKHTIPSHDKHDGEHHSDHHSNHTDHHDEEAHSDIKAVYKFDCTKGQLPSTVDVKLMEQFTGIETLITEWVTERKQGAEKLTPSQITVSLD